MKSKHGHRLLITETGASDGVAMLLIGQLAAGTSASTLKRRSFNRSVESLEGICPSVDTISLLLLLLLLDIYGNKPLQLNHALGLGLSRPTIVGLIRRRAFLIAPSGVYYYYYYFWLFVRYCRCCWPPYRSRPFN